MPPSYPTVLLVDDDFELLTTLQRAHSALEPEWDLVCTEDPKLVTGLIAESTVDLVVVDLVMSELEGLELIQRILAIRPDLPVIVITGMTESGISQLALRLGATAVVEKPFSFAELVEQIESKLGPEGDAGEAGGAGQS